MSNHWNLFLCTIQKKYYYFSVPKSKRICQLLLTPTDICCVRSSVSSLSVSRRWTAVTRWPVHRVDNTSVGCALAYSAKSTRTATLTTRIHPVSTSESSVTSSFCLLFCHHHYVILFNYFVLLLLYVIKLFLLFQTLPWCGSWWRRCLLEWWRGLMTVQYLTALCSTWMHFISHNLHVTSVCLH